jgi:membrane-associated protein
MEFLGFNLEELIRTVGYVGIFFMIFAESGVLIGIVFPGDSLLFTAGFLASAGVFNFPLLVAGCFIAAVLGDNVGYSFGKKVGPRIFNKEESFFFHKRHVERAKDFYARHGGKTLVIARFVPFVRTFAPILAGVGNMEYRSFFLYNLLGAFLWAVGVTSLGFALGNLIPDIDRYILPGVVIIVVISLIPTALHLFRERVLRRG